MRAYSVPAPQSIWTHLKYGKARVVAVSVYFESGQELVTVEYLGLGTVPAQVVTYPAEEFVERFRAGES